MATTTIHSTASTDASSEAQNITAAATRDFKEPLQLRGVHDQFESFDVTPVIGKEFSNANLAEWLEADNAEGSGHHQ